MTTHCIDTLGALRLRLKALEDEAAKLRDDILAASNPDLEGGAYVGKIVDIRRDVLDQSRLKADLGPDLSPWRTVTIQRQLRITPRAW